MISIIVAMTKDGLIGKDGDLPWYLPEDFKHFKKTTQNGTVIMGRKTYESIGKPLPNRNNIVLTRSKKEIKGCDVAHTFKQAIELSKRYDGKTFIIGGGNVYKQGLGVADELIITWVKKNYEGDTYFPKVNFDKWKKTKKEDYEEFEILWYTKKEN